MKYDDLSFTVKDNKGNDVVCDILSIVPNDENPKEEPSGKGESYTFEKTKVTPPEAPTAPVNEEFNTIVKTLAERHGITMPTEELILEANKWELSHGGLSGRTAQQFIDYLLGQNPV